MTQYARKQQAIVNQDQSAFQAAKAKRKAQKKIHLLQDKINNLESRVEQLEKTLSGSH